MKKVILDTSFILSCVREKIDFFEELKFMGFSIIIPKQVIGELQSVVESKKKLHFKEEAKLALIILKNHSFKEIDLHKKYVDEVLIKFANENIDVTVATMDKGIKDQIKNQLIIVRGKKKLELL